MTENRFESPQDGSEDQVMEKKLNQEIEEFKPEEIDSKIKEGPWYITAKEVPATKISDQEIKAAETEFNQSKAGEQINESFEQMNEGLNEFAEKMNQSGIKDEKGFAAKAKIFFADNKEFFDEGLERLNQLMNDGQEKQAKSSADDFVKRLKEKTGEYFGELAEKWFAEHDDLASQAEKEPVKSKKERLVRLAKEAIDFIPVVGSAKMISEGVAGRTFQREKISGAKRFIHTTEGAVFLTLDLIGGGAVKTSGKILTRSAALLRKMGASRKVYKPIYKSGRFVVKSPAVTKALDKGLYYITKRRNDRQKNVKQGLGQNLKQAA